MLRWLMFVILIFSCCVLTYAQRSDSKYDSLRQALSATTNESLKSEIELKICGELCLDRKFNEAIPLLNKLSIFFNNNKDVKNECKAKTYLGIAYSRGNIDVEKGVAELQAAELLANKIDADSSLINIYTTLIYINSGKGDFTKSIEYANKLLEVGERTKNNNIIALAIHYVGLSYASVGENEKAMDYYKKSLAIYQKIGDKSGQVDVELNIGERYLTLNELNLAEMHLNNALHLAEAIDYKSQEVNILKTLAGLYQIKNDTANLQSVLKAGISVAEATGNVATISSFKVTQCLFAINQIIQIDSITGNYNVISGKKQELSNLADTLKRQLEIYKNTSLEMSKWKDGYLALAITNNILNKPQEAFDNLNQYIYYNDSFANLEKSKQFSDMEKKLLNDAANAKVSYANRLRNISLIGVLALLLLSGFVVNAYRHKRKDNKQIAKERKKSDDLLLNILPQEVADELKTKGESKAQQYEEVSVLFTDFVNFTRISEKVGVEEILNELNVNFTAFDKIMESNGLEKIKTIGDAYLAVSGLPIANAKHAQNTVNAALEILSFVEKRKTEVPYGLDIRIGINSGALIAGIIGVKKFAYDIWGDTVNTAARMEQSSEAGKINISDNTYQLVKDDFECVHRGKISAKGKGEIDMYFVIDKR